MSWSDLGYTKRTIAHRRRILAELGNPCPGSSLSVKQVESFLKLRSQTLRPSSLLSLLGSLRSALKTRNVTIVGDLQGVQRYLRSRAMAQEIRFAKPLTADVMAQLLPRVRAHEDFLLLSFLWGFACRLTSLSGLRRRDVAYLYPPATTVTFRCGKTILATGPYTVTAALPAKVRHLIEARPPEDLLFPRSPSLYYNRLRAILPSGYEVRSFRRGALQAMAQAGTPEETLLLFSRHRNIENLRRYLQWGLYSRTEQTQAAQASAPLWA